MKKSHILTLLSLLATAAIAVAASTTPVFQLRLVLDTPGDSESMTYVTHYQGRSDTNVLNIQKTVLLDETALKSVKADKDGLNQPVLAITLTDAGAKKFAEITRQNLHKRLAIVINGQLCEAPVIQSEISGGKIQITGSFTKQEVKDLAKKISDASAKK